MLEPCSHNVPVLLSAMAPRPLAIVQSGQS
jgi:hypothetical protein